MPPPTTELTVTSNSRVLGEPAQLLIEHLQALLRHVVWHDVVDADLEVVESGSVQTLDAVATSGDTHW